MSSGAVVDAPRRRVTLEEVRAHREEIHAIAERYGVSNVRVFGSVARDEATDDSDLDLLVEITAGRDLFDLAGFALDVEETVGVFTQVTTDNGLRARIREHVLAEAVPVWIIVPPRSASGTCTTVPRQPDNSRPRRSTS